MVLFGQSQAQRQWGAWPLNCGLFPHQDYPVLLPVESGTGRSAGCVLGPETCSSQGLGHCPEGA